MKVNQILRKDDTHHMPQPKLTADILAAALIGFEVQKFAIDGKIAEIRLMLEGGRSEPAARPRSDSFERNAAEFGGRWPWRNGLDTPSSSKGQRRNQPLWRPRNQSER